METPKDTLNSPVITIPENPIRRMALSDIIPADYNPRVIRPANLERLRRIVTKYGIVTTLTWNERTQHLVGGHKRLDILRALGITEVDVTVVDVDETEEMALNVALNNRHAQGEFSDDELDEVLAAIEDADADLYEEMDFDALATEFDDDSEDTREAQGEGDDDERERGERGQQSEVQYPERSPAPEISDEEIDARADPTIVPVTKPGEVIELGGQRIHCADCLDVLADMPEASLDSIVCDPPYGINMMGKHWDCDVPGEAFARLALRALKPGGHLIAFAATRTVHRLMSALEDGGFELRDLIGWLQWQGFPKSMNVSKAIDAHLGSASHVLGPGVSTGCEYHQRGEVCRGHNDAGRSQSGPTIHAPATAPATAPAKRWEGYGTALKPAYEPAVLARKPLEGTVAENVLKWGVGGLNIDGCRIPFGDPAWPGPSDDEHLRGQNFSHTQEHSDRTFGLPAMGSLPYFHDRGRWPANIYYAPKPSPRERDEGTTETVDPSDVTGRDPDSAGQHNPRAGMRGNRPRGNHHISVKPIKLMRWLVRLVTPQGGIVCDPFLGSGTTLIAAELERFRGIGVERECAYVDIARARINAVLCQP